MSTNIILHGDARVLGKTAITRPINAIITDPPYGVNFVSNSVRRKHSEKFTRAIAADQDPEAAILLFRQVMAPLLPLCADVCELYVFTNWNVLESWMPLVKRIPGFELKQMLVWEKGYPGMGDIEYNWGCGHEIILYLKKGRRPVPYRRSGVLHVERLPTGKNVHPTEKPVQLLELLIGMSTDPGDLVVDPFSGSGSTAVAARNMERDSISFELDEEYARVGNERLNHHSLFST
jgi:adenine-specific DNA-methyltransferase